MNYDTPKAQTEKRTAAHMDTLKRFGFFEADKKMAMTFGKRLYDLTTGIGRTRLENYLGSWGKAAKKRDPELIASASFPSQVYGIEPSPLLRLTEGIIDDMLSQSDSNRLRNANVVVGHIYRKTEKPHTADLISVDTFTAESSKGPVKIRIGYVADGATMLVPRESGLWPKEVMETCAVTEEAVLPDVFWRAGLGAILNDCTIPTPQNFITHPAMEHMRNKKVQEAIREYISQSLFKRPLQGVAYDVVKKFINPSLGEFLRTAFPGFGEDNFELYPSGVLGVTITVDGYATGAFKGHTVFDREHIGQYLRGFAVTGDISIVVADNEFAGFLLLHNAEVVDDHDRALNDLLGRGDYGVLREIAHRRRFEVGNLQGGDGAIHYGTWGDPHNDRTGLVCSYTDGLKTYSNLTNYRKQSPATRLDTLGTDQTAPRFLRDAGLAILDQRLMNKARQRGDDGAYLMMGPQRVSNLWNMDSPFVDTP